MIKALTLTSTVASIVSLASLDAQLPEIREHTLRNGMRVLLVERHEEPTIACTWVAKVGSADERPGITGLAHLFEHMMFKGTTTIGTKDARRDAELNSLQDRVQAEIRKEMALLREKQRRGEIENMMDPSARSPRLQSLLNEFDSLVAEQRSLIVKDEMWDLYEAAGATGLNASTSNDRTNYIVSIPSNKLEFWTWIESDRLLNPVFREFYSERNVILEERKQTLESNSMGRINEAFTAMTWAASPYQWSVIGWESDITHVTREQANEFFANFYNPSNIVIILVGSFNSDNALSLIQRYFERIPANPRPVPEVVTEEPPQVGEKRMYAQAETSPSIRMTFKTVPAIHKDAPALSILSSILSGGGGGGNPSGRLGKSLVLEQQAALSASAFSSGMRFEGSFSLTASPTPGRNPADLEPLIYAEIQKLVQEGVTDAEMNRVRNAAQMRFYMTSESNTGLRGALTAAETTGTYRDYLQSLDRLQAVTKEDVVRVAREYLVKDRSSVLITTRAGAPASPGGPRAQRPVPTRQDLLMNELQEQLYSFLPHGHTQTFEVQ